MESSIRLLSTLNDLPDLSKLEAGRMTVTLEACTVRQVLEEIVQVVAPTAQAKKLNLEVKIHESVPPIVYTDPSRLRQIILNFSHNAVKFTEHGSVKLHAEVQPGTSTDRKELKLSVSDTGLGIDEDTKLKLFQPSFRRMAQQRDATPALG